MVKIVVLDQVDSTNEYLKRNDACAVLARIQTGGKGSKGRSFISHEGGLYLSVKLAIDKDILPFLTPITAVATVRAVQKVLNIGCRIKWVNDLIYPTTSPKKVCGILTESYSCGDSVKAIVGVGLNVFRDKANYDGVKVAGCLLDAEPDFDLIKRLAEEIIKELNARLEDVGKAMKEYRDLSCIIGEKVIYLADGKEIEAEVMDIEESGGLALKTSEGSFTANSGEIVWTKLS